MATGPLEKDTCRNYVLPRLYAAGWTQDQIQEQFAITAGRIVALGKKHRRGDALWADYVLEYVPGVPVAAVEAKRESQTVILEPGISIVLDDARAVGRVREGKVEQPAVVRQGPPASRSRHRMRPGTGTAGGRASSTTRQSTAYSHRSTALFATSMGR